MMSNPIGRASVLLPYRFTLFSNPLALKVKVTPVLLPYRFTLFSNHLCDFLGYCLVLLPYRFTLFSNRTCSTTNVLRFYYLIDLHYSQTY